MSEKQQAGRKPASLGRKWVQGFGFTILGIVAYCISDFMFSGYPQFGTNVINVVAIVLMVVGAAVVWIVDERRHGHDEDDVS